MTEPVNISSYESIARQIEWELLRPEMTEDELDDTCRRARELGAGVVVVRPSDADSALRWLSGSSVAVSSTAGWPDGASSTSTKLYEGRDLIRRGVRELDMVVNVGKVRSRQFQYVETELMQMARSCQESGVLLKLTLGSQWLEDDLHIIMLKICRRVEISYLTLGIEPAPYALLKPLRKDTALKARGVATLEQLLALREEGCSRFGVRDPEPILSELRMRLASQKQADLQAGMPLVGPAGAA